MALLKLNGGEYPVSNMAENREVRQLPIDFSPYGVPEYCWPKKSDTRDPNGASKNRCVDMPIELVDTATLLFPHRIKIP